MPPRFPVTKTYNGGAPKGSLLHNDDSIFGRMNRTDMNRGGGPTGAKASVSQNARTGAGTRANGRDPAPSHNFGGGRGSSGNPGASAGTRGGVGGSGISGEARGGAFSPETRIAGHGGSPQHREREIPGDFHKRGGVGAHGQEFVPGGSKSNLQRMGGNVTGSGNTSGTTHRQVAGNFKRKAMGARASGGENRGSYGAPPISANT